MLMTDKLRQISDYRDRLGNVIPDAAFENEPGPPRPLSTFMSAESLIDFYLQTIALRAAAEKIKTARRRHLGPRQ
jgi:hypothetical protein